MIPFDFEYYKPATAAEAIGLYGELDRQGKHPVYYSGGTEIITLGRFHYIQTHAVIDIKSIPECRVHGFQGNELVLGAALPLTTIEEANLFPLLTQTSREISDRTARNKITLGGNIAGNIFYRESVLPFLLADSDMLIAGRSGMTRRSIHDAFRQTLRLEKGEFLAALLTEQTYLGLPHISIKRHQQWETGYPVLTAAALKKEGRIRIAFSGLCPFPFRSKEMEEELNRKELSNEARIDQAILRLPAPPLNDVEGSPEYRLFVLRNTLLDLLTELEVEGHG